MGCAVWIGLPLISFSKIKLYIDVFRVPHNTKMPLILFISEKRVKQFYAEVEVFVSPKDSP